MLIFFLKLFLANLAGDFMFQPSIWVEKKTKKLGRSVYLYLHIAVHALCLLVLLQFDFRYLAGMVIILVSHYLIDLTRVSLTNRMNERLLFFCDQILHLVVIAWVVHIYYPYQVEFQWFYSEMTLITLTALVFVTFASSVIMKKLISRWEFVNSDDKKSLEKAGAYIGMLERLFIFGFIVLDYWEGIGFLLAAKSIFRFGDLSKSKDRKLTEYVLIGTLLSFGLAMGTGILYQYLLKVSL